MECFFYRCFAEYRFRNDRGTVIENFGVGPQKGSCPRRLEALYASGSFDRPDDWADHVERAGAGDNVTTSDTAPSIIAKESAVAAIIL